MTTTTLQNGQTPATRNEESTEDNTSGNTEDVETGMKKAAISGTEKLRNSNNKQPANDANNSDTESVSSQQSTFKFGTPGVRLLVTLVLFLGFATCAAFLGIGISGAVDQQQDEFQRSATDTTTKIVDAFDDYVNACSMVHARCRHRDFTRRDFRELYEYLIASGLDFKAVQFDPNITHAERPAAEAEARQYYAENYPHVDYQGFRGFNTPTSGLVPRTNQSFYFPIHYMEPIAGNEAAIDLDYHSSESRTRAVYALFDEEKPSITDRLALVREAGTASRCGNNVGVGYGVVLMHPGVRLEDSDDVWPRDFSSIVVCIPALLTRATSSQSQTSKVYLHDISDPTSEDPVFLGGALVTGTPDGPELTFLDELPLEDIVNDHKTQDTFQQDIFVANRVWTVTVLNVEEGTNTNIVFVILGGCIILFASILLAVWIYHSDRKTNRFNAMRATAEAEKAALILQNARQATKTERELNDFIAHEVRNPVAAAMAATNMMKLAIHKEEPLRDAESLDLARGDLNIIDSSLRFVNDLLRNMLDMHRAANKQLQVHMTPVDLLRDILEPVGGMLYRRGSKVEVIVECPDNFYVMADPLRLKQVILNLGRNSTKFIEEGFIRLKAEEVNGTVRIYVDDSGSGIPVEKRQRLFAKFQESLDMLSQGTGVGLFLCKNLVGLMGGEIYLDDDYHSGIEGHPGTRFVIDLKSKPIEPYFDDLPNHQNGGAAEHAAKGGNGGTATTTLTADEELHSLPSELPDKLSVLFVDDDAVLRKLFSRSLKVLVPNWSIREAANGETAIQLTEEPDASFDIIFIDMYMASVEKQLLGTEAVAELRNRGVKSRICGLSANDKEEAFYEAGADAFMFKPFPCEANALKSALIRILYQDNKSGYDAVDMY